jgi:hypothetical protein
MHDHLDDYKLNFIVVISRKNNIDLNNQSYNYENQILVYGAILLAFKS